MQAATIPSMKGCIVRACVGDGYSPNEQFLFEPRHEALEPLGLCAHESLMTVSDGIALIPLQNFQGVSVKLDKGTPLGMVQPCKPLCQDLAQPGEGPSLPDSLGGGLCAHVKALPNTPERYQRLLEALELPEELGNDEMKQLKELLRESADVFALDDSELGCTDLVRHVIDTGDHSPLRQPPHRTPMVYRDKIEQLVDEMQGRGIIRPSTSPWASPVVLVPKKDGSLRFCIDYRRLNAITKKDVYPLPRIDDIFDTLGGAKFFTSLDLASGYWQVELDEDARAKSAFATYQGLFEFTRMPFGLCNAPATFQRIMQLVLAGLEWRHCFVYLDDILVVSRTFEEHIGHLREVFNRLRSAGLRLKPKKCLILRDEVPYLGHVISARGVRPDPSKTEKVQHFPVPYDVTSVRQFIGLASYYRRFVPDFARIAAPLHALTRKNVVFKWSGACAMAFQQLKEALITAPILACPKFGPGVEFVLETDASGVGLGAVLSQLQDDGQLHPVAYASRSLDTSEKNYGISELETLGLVWAARHFRPYILGHHTTVYTDHSACLSLLQRARPSGKLARWALAIQELDLTIRHRSGRQNSNADALSRNTAPSANYGAASDEEAMQKTECVNVCPDGKCMCIIDGFCKPAKSDVNVCPDGKCMVMVSEVDDFCKPTKIDVDVCPDGKCVCAVISEAECCKPTKIDVDVCSTDKGMCAVVSETNDFCKATKSDVDMCTNGKCVCAVLSENSDFCKAAGSDVTVCPHGNRVCVVSSNSDFCKAAGSDVTVCPHGNRVCVVSSNNDFCKATGSDVTVCPHGNRVCVVSSNSDFCKAAESDVTVCPHGNCVCAVSSKSSDFYKTIGSESDVSVCPHGTCKCNVCAVVCEDSDLCKMRSSLEDVRECQMKDPELKVYVKYLEEKALPTDGGAARRLVCESKAFERSMEYCIVSLPRFRADGVWSSRQS